MRLYGFCGNGDLVLERQKKANMLIYRNENKFKKLLALNVVASKRKATQMKIIRKSQKD